MTMDPDDWIREQLFQRLVDAAHLDVTRTPRKIWNVGGNLFNLAALSLWWMCFTISVQMGMDPYAQIIPFGMAFFIICQVRWHIALPPAIGLLQIRTLQRLVMVCIAVLLTILILFEMITGDMTMKLVDLAFVDIGWSLVVASWYVHMCRKAPPRRPKEARMSAGRFAIAGT